MCEPVTLMTIATAAAVAGTGVAVYGAVEQGKAQRDAMNYQAGVAKNNAIIADQNATNANQAGQVGAESASLKNAQMVGRTRAMAGASGVSANDGSPLAVAASTDRLGILDALTIRSNAGRTAYGYKVAGMGYTAQSALDAATAGNAGTAGAINAASSIAGGASSVADKWLYYQRLNPGMGGNSSVYVNPAPSMAG